MLTAIAPSLPRSLPAREPAPAPNPAPAPAPGPDTLDFSKIDCPRKAALLPINEPALQVSLAAGILFAVMAGAQGGAVPLITIDLASKSAGKNMNASYTLDLKNEKEPLSVSGDVAGQPLSDSFSIDQVKKSAQFKGSVGSNPTCLTLATDDKSQALLVNGKLGDVDANLKLSVIKGARGDQDIRGIHEEGTLGGVPYSVDSSFDPQAIGGAATSKQQAKMTVRGKLGDQDITKDYTLTARQLPTGAELDFAGSGSTAGVAQDVSVKLSLVG